MSEKQVDQTAATVRDPATAPPSTAGSPLADLMAAGAAPKAPAPPAPDLEAEALRAAEAALAEGQKALAVARAQLGPTFDRPVRSQRTRELLLRGLLLVNVVAMLVVALLPTPSAGPAADPAPSGHEAGPGAGPAPADAAPKLSDPWNRALAAAERRDFAQAIAILEQYLTDSPRMAPSQQLSVLMALGHYAARRNDFAAAQAYQRRAEAIEKSHSLPEDLVAMAKAAAESGDQESLRRVWARFLLQQRQVPSWLYKHVAEAYLQLGDSYRKEANAAAEQARLRELEETAARLRAETEAKEDGK